MRCSADGCRRKVTEFNDFVCSHCEKLYCGVHRLPGKEGSKFDIGKSHSCNMEAIQEKHKKKLEKQNPVIIADKFVKI